MSLLSLRPLRGNGTSAGVTSPYQHVCSSYMLLPHGKWIRRRQGPAWGGTIGCHKLPMEGKCGARLLSHHGLLIGTREDYFFPPIKCNYKGGITKRGHRWPRWPSGDDRLATVLRRFDRCFWMGVDLCPFLRLLFYSSSSWKGFNPMPARNFALPGFTSSQTTVQRVLLCCVVGIRGQLRRMRSEDLTKGHHFAICCLL